MMSDIALVLNNLKVDLRLKGYLITLTPDDLFRCYIQYLPFLLFDAMS